MFDPIVTWMELGRKCYKKNLRLDHPLEKMRQSLPKWPITDVRIIFEKMEPIMNFCKLQSHKKKVQNARSETKKKKSSLVSTIWISSKTGLLFYV